MGPTFKFVQDLIYLAFRWLYKLCMALYSSLIWPYVALGAL